MFSSGQISNFNRLCYATAAVYLLLFIPWSLKRWTMDYGDLFKLHPDNTFLIKMAYWLNR